MKHQVYRDTHRNIFIVTENNVVSTLRLSQAVAHPSTLQALHCFTMEFRWDPVLSVQYGRQLIITNFKIFIYCTYAFHNEKIELFIGFAVLIAISRILKSNPFIPMYLVHNKSERRCIFNVSEWSNCRFTYSCRVMTLSVSGQYHLQSFNRWNEKLRFNHLHLTHDTA